MSSCLERSWIRRRLVPLLALGGAAAGALSAGGCARQAPQQPYTPPPLVIDAAMQRREWERAVAYYPNGDTVSGHNRFPVRSDADVGGYKITDPAYDIGASLVQTVALPFTYIFIPPFARAVYTGEDFGRTYTGMPPMRPDAVTVRVDGRDVERETLEVRPPPPSQQNERYQRHGPQGPGDTEFMSSPPTPTED